MLSIYEFYIVLAITIGIFIFLLKRFGITLFLKFIGIGVGIIISLTVMFLGWNKVNTSIETKPKVCGLLGGTPGIRIDKNPNSDGRLPKDPYRLKYCILKENNYFECPICKFSNQ